MSRWMNVGEVLDTGAYLYPDKVAVRDSKRSFTYKECNDRSNRLANALIGLGLKKGDRFAAIAYNRAEWTEIYTAAAKAGLIAVPIVFRLAPPEYQYILANAEASAFIVEKDFVEGVNSIRDSVSSIPSGNYIFLGEGDPPDGYKHYETLINEASPEKPDVEVHHEDLWILGYTSGTTGKPKGALRSHESYTAIYVSLIPELGFNRNDTGLMVMPMCHFNSIFFSFLCLYTYASVCVYDNITFDPEDLLRTLSEEKITFTSLIPTHYIMMLALPDEVKNKYDVSCVEKLMCSSAPVRRDTKEGILEFFKNSKLVEGYGSTEGGLGTLLRPEDLLNKLTSIGRETIGMHRIKLLDEDGNEVPVGEVGELYTRGCSLFNGYWKMPEETKKAFKGEYFSAGDMAKKDEDGFYYLVDRKKNMIITGGENVYPSEVENVVGSHPSVKDIAVIGVPHDKWGEQVTAVVVLHDNVEESEELKKEIIEHSKGKIAGFKRPKAIEIIKEDEMPRNATGKILHRVLRQEYGTWSEQ